MAHYDLPHQHGQDFKLVLEKVPDDEQFRIVSAAFQQLSDPTRLKIMWLLCHSEECVYNIACLLYTSSLYNMSDNTELSICQSTPLTSKWVWESFNKFTDKLFNS